MLLHDSALDLVNAAGRTAFDHIIQTKRQSAYHITKKGIVIETPKTPKSTRSLKLPEVVFDYLKKLLVYYNEKAAKLGTKWINDNNAVNLFFVIMLLFIGSIALYYLIIHIIKRWTGCDNTEAEQKIHNFVNGRKPYSFDKDDGFINEVWWNIRNIIGDKRFEQLCRLSQTAIGTHLLIFGHSSGLPYIAITVPYANNSEKQIIESISSTLVKRYLQIYGYNTRVITDWKTRYDLNMPYLEIRYATSKEENRIMDIVLQNVQRNIISQNSAITDDEDENDLDE